MCPTGACSEVLLLQVCRETSHLELTLLPNHLNINSFCIYTISRCAKAFCFIPLMSHSGQRLCLLIFWLSCIFDAEVKEAWKQFWVDFVIYNILRKSSNVPESFRLRLHPPFGRVRPWFSHPAGNCPRGRGRPRLSVILFRVARASWHYLIAVCKRFSDFYNFDTLKTVFFSIITSLAELWIAFKLFNFDTMKTAGLY